MQLLTWRSPPTGLKRADTHWALALYPPGSADLNQFKRVKTELFHGAPWNDSHAKKALMTTQRMESGHTFASDARTKHLH